MELNSLGRKTDLIFAKFSGEVYDKNGCKVVRTPSNPGYHWGNYIVFNEEPKKGDLKKWKQVFDDEFEYYNEPHHYTFVWNNDKPGTDAHAEFLEEGFEFDSAKVLLTTKLNKPKYYNAEIEVRTLVSDEDWEKAIQLQISSAEKKYLNHYYEEFKRKQFSQYRKMSEAGLGHWFGAFLGEQIVGDLGVYFENDCARYQSVETHESFRRQGICGTLVYEAGQYALSHYGVKYLVMEADPEYHAARIYESVGFKAKEINYSLCWWKKS